MAKVKGKAPASWFYWKDFDIDTRNMTLEMVGAWMRIMTHLHFSKTRGEKIQSIEAWAGVLGVSKNKTENVILKLRECDVGIVKKLRGKTQITSRRMVQEEAEKRKERQNKWNQRHANSTK